jgi:rhodanese-related sulfurtransferase
MASSETLKPEQARQLIASAGPAQVIDIRDQEAWLDGHVPGANRIDPDDLDTAVKGLSEDDPVVVVGEDTESATRVAEALAERGYEAQVLEGGMDSWKSEDFTLQPSHDPEDDAPVDPDEGEGIREAST